MVMNCYLLKQVSRREIIILLSPLFYILENNKTLFHNAGEGEEGRGRVFCPACMRPSVCSLASQNIQTKPACQQ